MFHLAFVLFALTTENPDVSKDTLRETKNREISSEHLHVSSDASFRTESQQLDRHISVALLFDDNVSAAVRERVRKDIRDLREMEIQPSVDTESLLQRFDCNGPWLSCQILAGQKLGVEKTLVLRFLAPDALSVQVFDIRLEISRGQLVIPWREIDKPTAHSTSHPLRIRLRNAMLVLLREAPVMGELVLLDAPGGRIRVDGLIFPETTNVPKRLSLFAGTHLLEYEDENERWQSLWVEVPGEDRLEVLLSAQKPPPESDSDDDERGKEYAATLGMTLMSTGTVTMMGSAGLWAFASSMSNQPVPPGTSPLVVEQRLMIWERGQQGAWALGGVGLAMTGFGIFLLVKSGSFF